MMQEIYKDDYIYGKQDGIRSEGDKVITMDKFLHPHGVCQQMTNYSMEKKYKISWGDFGLYGIGNTDYPDMSISLTDPYRQRFSSIDLTSQSGDKLELKEGYSHIYEVHILVQDTRDPTNPGFCTDKVSYSDCVDQQTETLFVEVKT